MSRNACLFGGAMFAAGLASAPAPAGVEPVSISSSNSGFTATLDGTPISDFAQNTGPTGPIAYTGSGLDVFAEATTSRFAARISLDPSDTSWDFSYILSRAEFTVNESFDAVVSWDFGSWSFGFVEVRDLTAAQDVVSETQNSMSSGAVPISFVEGRQYRFRVTILGKDGGGVGFGLLSIDEDAVIFRQPRSRVVRAGDGATLSVGVFGRGEPDAQWRRDGVALVDGDGVSGATALELTIDPASYADAGVYDCVVDGDTSDGAFLVVQPCLAGDANGDGVVDFSDLNAVLGQFGAGCGE